MAAADRIRVVGIIYSDNRPRWHAVARLFRRVDASRPELCYLVGVASAAVLSESNECGGHCVNEPGSGVGPKRDDLPIRTPKVMMRFDHRLGRYVPDVGGDRDGRVHRQPNRGAFSAGAEARSAAPTYRTDARASLSPRSVRMSDVPRLRESKSSQLPRQFMNLPDLSPVEQAAITKRKSSAWLKSIFAVAFVSMLVVIGLGIASFATGENGGEASVLNEAGGRAGAVQRACDLLTKDEVEQVLGFRVQSVDEQIGNLTGGVAMLRQCFWKGGDSVGAPSAFITVRSSDQRQCKSTGEALGPNMTMEPVSELGVNSYWLTDRYESTTIQLMCTNRAKAEILLNTGNPAATKEQALTLMIKMVKRL